MRLTFRIEWGGTTELFRVRTATPWVLKFDPVKPKPFYPIGCHRLPFIKLEKIKLQNKKGETK